MGPLGPAGARAGRRACWGADGAALRGVGAGPDPADPATAQQAGQVPDYPPFLDTGALDGARLGIWRDGSAEARPAAISGLDASITRLRERGAAVIDPVHLPDADRISAPEHPPLLHALKHDIDAYLGAPGGDHPASLAALI